MTFKGVDLSKWQESKNIDYKTLASQIDFAILKAGGSHQGKQGSFYKDAEFEEHYSQLTKLGVPLGAYWYSIADTEARGRAEAREMIKVLGLKQFEYPIICDAEYKTCTVEGVRGFLDELEKQGYYAMLYTGHNFYKDKLDSSRLSRYDLWIADYTGSADPGRSFGIWQHTEKGRLKGYNGDLDLNIAYRDYPKRIKDRNLNHLKTEEVKPHKPVWHELLIAHIKPGSLKVKKGDIVKKGQLLATMGESGVSNGIHGHICYFEMVTPYVPWMYEHQKFKASQKKTLDFIKQPGFMVDAKTKKARKMKVTNGWYGSKDGFKTYDGHYGYDVIAEGAGIPLFAWPLDAPGEVTSVWNYGSKRFGQVLMIKFDSAYKKPSTNIGKGAKIKTDPPIGVNVRATPGLDGRKVEYLEPGTKIGVLEEVRDKDLMIWYRIGKNKFVKNDFVELL